MSPDLFTLWEYDVEIPGIPFRIVASSLQEIPYPTHLATVEDAATPFPLLSVASNNGRVIDWSFTAVDAFNVRWTTELGPEWDRSIRDNADAIEAQLIATRQTHTQPTGV